jgi:hypothetical protein
LFLFSIVGGTKVGKTKIMFVVNQTEEIWEIFKVQTWITNGQGHPTPIAMLQFFPHLPGEGL